MGPVETDKVLLKCAWRGSLQRPTGGRIDQLVLQFPTSTSRYFVRDLPTRECDTSQFCSFIRVIEGTPPTVTTPTVLSVTIEKLRRLSVEMGIVAQTEWMISNPYTQEIEIVSKPTKMSKSIPLELPGSFVSGQTYILEVTAPGVGLASARLVEEPVGGQRDPRIGFMEILEALRCSQVRPSKEENTNEIKERYHQLACQDKLYEIERYQALLRGDKGSVAEIWKKEMPNAGQLAALRTELIKRGVEVAVSTKEYQTLAAESQRLKTACQEKGLLL